MRSDRSSWWLCLPLLVLITGLVPAAGLQNLQDASVAAARDAPADLPASPRDAVASTRISPSFAGLQAGIRNQNQQSRGIRLMDVFACLACMVLIMRQARHRAWSRSAVMTPGHGSMLSQLRTQYLQL